MANRLGGIGGKAQTPAGMVAHHHGLEAGLVDGDLTGIEPIDLTSVDVHADDVVTDLGKAGTGDQPHIAGPENGNAHRSPPWWIQLAPAAASRATFIMSWKLFCRSSALVEAPVMTWSLTVRMLTARLPVSAATP